MIPFTYCITHLPTNRRYYGSRYARNCHPDDLGKTYFSSSKTVTKMIKEEGVENFLFEVRKTFDSPKDCLEWETKVLTRLDAMNSDRWLNRSNSGMSWYNGGPMSNEHRSKISAANKGKPRNENQKRAVSESNKRRGVSDTTKAKLSESMSGSGNPMFGRSRKGETHNWTDEGKAKQCKAVSAPISCLGIVYPSIKDAVAAGHKNLRAKLDNPKYPEYPEYFRLKPKTKRPRRVA